MAEFKMSLVQRKNLKENDEKLQESMQKIKDATGEQDWAMEIDWGSVYSTYQLGDRPGDTIYDSCMSALASNIESLCKNEDAKNALNTAVNQHKIIFTVDKKASSYWSEKINNGCIEIGYKGSICNVYDLGNSIEGLLTVNYEDVDMPLKLKKNIDEVQEKHEELKEKLRDATGRDFTLKIEWAQMITDHMDKNYPGSFGSTLLESCFEGLVSNIVRVCTNEAYPGKDAFNEHASSGVIIFNSNKNDKKAPSYFATKFENGDLVVSFKYICNTYDIGSNIPELMTVEYEEVKMPFLTRKSLAEKEEKKEEYMGIINEATGRTMELHVDWPKMLPFMIKDSRPDYVGSTLYESVLEGLSSNIKKLCEDDMGKEAFNESVTSGKIVLTTWDDKKASGYVKESFDNGDAVIAFKTICNTYEIGAGFEKLL
jgi:hypothetical protein